MPTQRRSPPAKRTAPAPAMAPGLKPMGEADILALQTLLDQLPAPLQPLDVVAIDGYLCGVLLQPRPVPLAQWLPPIVDVDGRPLPPGLDLSRLQGLLSRRADELNRAIAARQWFDPWVFELDDDGIDDGDGGDGGDTDDDDAAGGHGAFSEMVLPWVAGFAAAVERFEGLLDRHEADLTEPLATLYRHFDPDDLEADEALQAEIASLAPPESLAEAVEDLVRSVLLIADVSRPRAAFPGGAPAGRRPVRSTRPAKPRR